MDYRQDLDFSTNRKVDKVLTNWSFALSVNGVNLRQVIFCVICLHSFGYKNGILLLLQLNGLYVYRGPFLKAYGGTAEVFEN